MKTQNERDKRNRRILAAFSEDAKPYTEDELRVRHVSQKELLEAMKTRPALVKIDAILGTNATPDQKIELFGLFQGYAESAIQRTIRDLTWRDCK